MSSEKNVPPYTNPPVVIPVEPTNVDSFQPVKPCKSCCTGKVIIIVISTVVLILLALGTAAFFLYPRKITPKVLGFSKTGLRLEVHSENYIDITINSLDANVTYNSQHVASLHKSNFKIKGGGTTIVDVPVSNLKIPDSAIDQCIHGSNLPIQVNVTVDPKLLSWTGKKISFPVHESVPCSELVGKKVSQEQLELAKRYPTLAKQYIKEMM